MLDKCNYRAAKKRSQVGRTAAIFTVVSLTTGGADNLPGTPAATARRAPHTVYVKTLYLITEQLM